MFKLRNVIKYQSAAFNYEKMKYYELKAAEGYDWIWSNEVKLRGYTMDFEGKPILDEWKKIEIDYVDKGMRDFDICVATSPLYILSKKAYSLLQNILIQYGEFLPFKSPNDNYVGYHCTNIIENALNVKNSEFDWLDKDEGWINGILKYSFFKENIDNQLIFRLPSKYSYITFFNEEFKQIIEKHSLKAFEFSELKKVELI